MNLIDEHEIAPLVGPGFVFGVHENKTAICRGLLSVEESSRGLFHFVEQLLREKSLFDQLLRCERAVVLFLFRSGIENGFRQFFIFFMPSGRFKSSNWRIPF